jgi:dTDP-D-glucose 4,6-dehydratase
MLPAQPGDVPRTFADVGALVADIGFQPKTSIGEGIRRFVAWYTRNSNAWRKRPQTTSADTVEPMNVVAKVRPSKILFLEFR